MTCICNRNHVDDDEHTPACQQHSELTALRAQLAAVEQQLTTTTALLGECEPHLEQYLDLVDDCSGKIPTPQLGSLLTRIRAATKGKT